MSPLRSGFPVRLANLTIPLRDLRPYAIFSIIKGMGFKFLITDDSMVARMLLKRILQETKAIIVEKESGEATLAELAQVQDYDVVFLDITMPGLSGLETLRRIKQILPNLPVVMVTADIQKQTIAEAMAAGAFEVIRKKIDYELIFGMLKRLFGDRVDS